MDQSAPADARDRLLLAADQLLDASHGEPISTRAICDRAGVRAPTLYHHFGDKQGLFDAVLNHGFKQFLSARQSQTAPHDSADPLSDVRAAWDNHVQFGLQHPTFYALIYAQLQPGRPCGVIEDVKAMLLEALKPAARQGRLCVSPADAAEQILAASVGVTLSLITQPPETINLRLSDQVRDAMLDAITVGAPTTVPPRPRALSDDAVPTAAVALAVALEDAPTPLVPASRPSSASGSAVSAYGRFRYHPRVIDTPDASPPVTASPDELAADAPARWHRDRRDRFRAEAAILAVQADSLANVRLLLFLGLAIAVGWALFTTPPLAYGLAVAAVVLLIAFIVQVRRYRKVERRRRHLSGLADLADEALLRIARDWKQLPLRHQDRAEPTHPYGPDLDILGHGSLLHLLESTGTRLGEGYPERLAADPGRDLHHPRAPGRRRRAGPAGRVARGAGLARPSHRHALARSRAVPGLG